jgi:glycosyltransferase involved in cell wall biosynthesis
MDLQETPWKARQLVGSFRRTRSGRLVPRSNEAFEQADHVIVQSETQLRRFRQKYDTPATLVRNMLPDMVPPSREPPRNRVLWVGSIKEVKRPELFVELARVSRGSALEFTMVGEIQDRRAGAAVLAADKALAGFTYVPSLPLLDAWQRIATSRMLVNTSRIEGFPNTFIQAWLSGIPVATLGVDPDGVIRRRRIGIVCSDVTDLRRSLLGGILDGPRWHGQAGRARRHASTTHSIDVNGPLFSRVLEEARAEYHAS